MKVILNQDVKHLGEMGDVKNVANGYARNYLFPHMYAVPYNDATVAYFESRKEEIEARKEQKRKDSASLKEKLEGLSIELEVPAGANGKLYGAVTALTVSEYLAKNGIEIERKRIDLTAIKTVGTYHATVRLYEAQTAELKVTVKGQETEETKAPAKKEAKAEVSESEAAETTEEKAE